jgi:hypothetical protein
VPGSGCSFHQPVQFGLDVIKYFGLFAFEDWLRVPDASFAPVPGLLSAAGDFLAQIKQPSAQSIIAEKEAKRSAMFLGTNSLGQKIALAPQRLLLVLLPLPVSSAAIRIGLILPGSWHGVIRSVTNLKPAQVKELRRRAAAGEDKAQVAQSFGISRASVYNYMA